MRGRDGDAHIFGTNDSLVKDEDVHNVISQDYE
jgi:hypothetical protein